MEHWEDLKWDIAERYGVDLDVDASRVSWHWLTSRIRALLSAPVGGYAPDGTPYFATRAQARLTPVRRPAHGKHR